MVALLGAYAVYIPITLLNYKFDELINRLRVAIRWNNEEALHRILKSYDELIGVVQQLSGPYNIIIGLVYCIVPYLIVVNVELVKLERNDLLFIFNKYLHWFVLFICNVNAFIINQISASITVRNKSIHKYLYPMFINGRNRNLRIKLKFDSFIDRLNNQFIGYYCFNLFEFTKMAFYQYIFTITSTYFLMSQFFYE